MKYDQGRVKDIEMLEGKLRQSVDPSQRSKIKTTLDHIKRQAENEGLANARNTLLEARRRATDARGEINIKNAREDANKLEEQIHRQFPSWQDHNGCGRLWVWNTYL